MSVLTLKSNNPLRVSSVLRQGDRARAVVFHKNIGSYVEVEIRAVAHWGFYGVIRGKEADNLFKQFNKDYATEMIKRQFIVKWCHVEHLVLL